MHPHSSRVLFLPPRIATTVLAILVITGCNLPKPTSSGNQESDTGGPYATSQQSLGGVDESDVMMGAYLHCPSKREMWTLCLNHSMTVKWFAPPGSVTMTTTSQCMQIPVSKYVAPVDQVISVNICGKAEDDDVKCTIEGKTTLSVSADAICRNYAWAVETVNIDENWGIAQAEMHCSCKGKGDCHPYNGPVQIPGLGDQKITWDFSLKESGTTDCKPLPISGGIIYGQLNYCFGSVLEVGLEPLVPCP